MSGGIASVSAFSTMRRETLHTLIGGLVVLIGALILVVSYRSGQPGATSAEGYRISASFKEIDGVTPGAEVLLTGISVGEVEKQYLDTDTNRAVVVMRIREGVPIPYDSSIKILSEGIAGGKYLKISPGGDLEMMQPGDSFDFTQSAVRFEELLQKVILTAEAQRKAKQAEDEPSPADGASDAEAGDGEGGSDGLGGFGMPSLSGD
jgi:phospholipid/cholesterol/gamma-HCH transport system substrate-binding protein